MEKQLCDCKATSERVIKKYKLAKHPKAERTERSNEKRPKLLRVRKRQDQEANAAEEIYLEFDKKGNYKRHALFSEKEAALKRLDELGLEAEANTFKLSTKTTSKPSKTVVFKRIKVPGMKETEMVHLIGEQSASI